LLQFQAKQFVMMMMMMMMMITYVENMPIRQNVVSFASLKKTVY